MSKENTVLSALLKQEGVYIAEKAPSCFDTSFFPTSPSLNYAVGGRGIPFGRVVVKYGPKSGGKSLTAMVEFAEIQRLDPDAWIIYISSEFDVDKSKLALYGMDLSRTIIRETNKPKEIFDWIENDISALIDSGIKVRGLAIDTIKAIRGPKEQNLENSEDHVMGDLSAYLNKAFKLIIPVIRRKKIYTVLVQQVNQEFDSMKQKQGIKWTLPNGEALAHAADVLQLIERIDSKDTKIFDQEITMVNNMPEQIGHRVRVKIEKNRVGPPSRVAEFDIEYRRGIVNQHVEIGLLAINTGIVQRPNNRTYIFGESKWSSKEEYYKSIAEDQKLASAIYLEVIKRA